LNPEAIVRCFAAIASRRKRAVVAAADVDAVATTAADAAVVAADATNLTHKLHTRRPTRDKHVGLLLLDSLCDWSQVSARYNHFSTPSILTKIAALCFQSIVRFDVGVLEFKSEF
jgi:hypothetical protein